MGDVSEIARRLPDGKVQFGWSGNGGYYSHLGWRLLEWYDDGPEIVDYLFDLGQLSLVGKPHSEDDSAVHWFHRTTRSVSRGIEPHYIGESENDVWSKIAFVDHVYFYDTDNRWYYIDDAYFNIKIPLWYINNAIDDEKKIDEFMVCADIRKRLAIFIMGDYLSSDPEFHNYLKKKKIDPVGVNENLDSETVWTLLKSVRDYFDPWAVVLTDEEDEEITGFLIRKKAGKHIETNKWKLKESDKQ